MSRANSYANGLNDAPEHGEGLMATKHKSMSDLQVRGGVFRRGVLEYNGCGDFLGLNIASPNHKRSNRMRCGNCGESTHITIDCELLLDQDESMIKMEKSYLQREKDRSAKLVYDPEDLFDEAEIENENTIKLALTPPSTSPDTVDMVAMDQTA